MYACKGYDDNKVSWRWSSRCFTVHEVDQICWRRCRRRHSRSVSAGSSSTSSWKLSSGQVPTNRHIRQRSVSVSGVGHDASVCRRRILVLQVDIDARFRLDTFAEAVSAESQRSQRTRRHKRSSCANHGAQKVHLPRRNNPHTATHSRQPRGAAIVRVEYAVRIQLCRTIQACVVCRTTAAESW